MERVHGTSQPGRTAVLGSRISSPRFPGSHGAPGPAPKRAHRNPHVLDCLVDRIYDAVAEPARWGTFLRELVHVVDAKSGLLRIIDRQRQRVLSSHDCDLDPELQERYARYYIDQDPFAAGLLDHPPGTILTGDRLVEPATLRKTEFFSDYLRPQRIEHVAGGLPQADEGHVTALGVHRPRSARPFDEGELAVLRYLVPHVRRAVRLQRTVQRRDSERKVSSHALESLEVAMLLLDEGARVIHANRHGRQLLANEQGLRLHQGRLVCRALHHQGKLDGLLQRGRLAARGDAPPGTAAILLADHENHAPHLVVIAYPIPRQREQIRDSWPAATVALFVSDVFATGLLCPAFVADLFGLTPCEARLAAALARGRDMERLCEQWQVSIHTLRAQLKAIFRKTGVRRQVDLVRLLLGNPWGLATDEHDET